jgi:uncharacterized membrane protein
MGRALLLVLASFMFLLASRYLTLNPDAYFAQQRAVYLANTAMLLLHIVGAMFAVILGPIQFLLANRTGRWLKLHRWLGRLYMLGVLAGGVGSLYLSVLAYGGWPTRLGFATLGVLWLFSGYKAYKHIRNKEIDRHQDWITRNYALTFAAVMLRLWLIVFQIVGLEFGMAYLIVAWLCWIPNLFVAQWMIQHRRASLVRAKTVRSVLEVASR